MDSEVIANFCSITGSTPTTAEYYLNAADGDLDMGIGLFYEAGGREAGDKDREMQAAVSVIEPTIDEEVRIISSSTATTGGVRNIFNPPSMRPVVHVINESESDEELTFTANATRASYEATPAQRTRAQRLADLFKSPHEIMFPGTFDSARRHARVQNRWLLVTLHVPTEFCCQAMNRDCWNDPSLQEFVKENLVFLQLAEGSPEAQRYANFYPFEGVLPHTALIDPRTGERVKTLMVATIPVPGFRVINGAGEMLEELVSFTSDNPIESLTESRQSYASVSADTNASENASITDNSSANLGDNSSSIPTPTSITPTSNTSITPTTATSSSAQAERPLSPSAGKKPKVSYQMPQEPDSSVTSTTNIQLRLPDGSRLKRRFALDSRVEEVFAVAEAACQQGRNEFELRSAEGVVEVEGAGEKKISEVSGLKNSVITIVQK